MKLGPKPIKGSHFYKCKQQILPEEKAQEDQTLRSEERKK